MVVVEVRTAPRMEARRAYTAAAQFPVAAAHAVHVGRRGPDIGYVTAEIGHAHHLLDFGHDRPLAARVDELALMRRYGAERAAAETAAVDIYRVLDHLPRRYGPAPSVTRVRSPLVRQIERVVQLLGRKRSIGRRHHDIPAAHGLHQRRIGLHTVAEALLDDEVAAEGPLVAAALLVRCQMLRRRGVETRHIAPVGHERHLPQPAQQFGVVAVAHGLGHLLHHPLTHAVDYKVGAAVDEDRRVERIAPIVVMRKPPQRGLDATRNNRHMGEQTFQDAAIYRHGTVGTESRPAARRIGVVAAQAQVGRIVVHHGVHGPRRHPEEEARRPQLGKVAQVVPPVGLRHDGHTVSLGLEQAPYDRRPESRMVDIGIPREKDHVKVIPSPLAHLPYRRRQKHFRDFIGS